MTREELLANCGNQYERERTRSDGRKGNLSTSLERKHSNLIKQRSEPLGGANSVVKEP
jgi:hypothetical protein